MGKSNKRQKLKHTNHHDNPKTQSQGRTVVARRQHSQKNRAGSKPYPNKSQQVQNQSNNKSPSGKQQQQQRAPVRIPFQSWDRVLLIGEGDLSFALSLIRHHKVSSVIATSLDDEREIETKYGASGLRAIRELQLSHRSHSDNEATATNSDGSPRHHTVLTEDHENENEDETGPTDKRQNIHRSPSDTHETTWIGNIDATKLDHKHKKTLQKHAPFTKIVFNFPHVGGLSTDVNRQVRSNQQLLVGFFNAAKGFLATKGRPAKPPSSLLPSTTRDTEAEDEDHDADVTSEEEGKTTVTPSSSQLQSGQILVTLFEGEPYTLWNIRDLARHCGLKVIESFKFPWEAYPGYRHARTIGDITNGVDRSEEGKRKGAWRGEERDARCYVLGLKDGEGLYPAPGHGKKRKKKKGSGLGSDDDDDDDDDESE